MGIFYTTISLSNPRLPDLRPIEVQALADTGSMYICLPEHVARKLGPNPLNPNIPHGLAQQFSAQLQ